MVEKSRVAAAAADPHINQTVEHLDAYHSSVILE